MEYEVKRPTDASAEVPPADQPFALWGALLGVVVSYFEDKDIDSAFGIKALRPHLLRENARRHTREWIVEVHGAKEAKRCATLMQQLAWMAVPWRSKHVNGIVVHDEQPWYTNKALKWFALGAAAVADPRLELHTTEFVKLVYYCDVTWVQLRTVSHSIEEAVRAYSFVTDPERNIYDEYGQRCWACPVGNLADDYKLVPAVDPAHWKTLFGQYEALREARATIGDDEIEDMLDRIHDTNHWASLAVVIKDMPDTYRKLQKCSGDAWRDLLPL